MSAAFITILEAEEPKILAKRYSRQHDGSVKGLALANVTRATARTLEVDTAAAFADELRRVTEGTNLCIVPGRWRGADPGMSFGVIPERNLRRCSGPAMPTEHDFPFHQPRGSGALVTARLKRYIQPADWLLLDFDNPPGIPDDLRQMSIQQRLEFLESIVPGISRCERIEARSSSARVVNGAGPGAHSHAWVRVSDASKVEALRSHVKVGMVVGDRAFPSPRHSSETGEVIGREWRTVLDISVWIAGRIVFCSKPSLAPDLDGYSVADADVRIVNEGCGILDIDEMQVPEPRALTAYRRKTGSTLKFAQRGGDVHTEVDGELTLDTEIEANGVCRLLRDWIREMPAGGKLRCQAPFRASTSTAAFIRLGKDGRPFIYDIGLNAKYTLAEDAEAPRVTRQHVLEANVSTEAGAATVEAYAEQERAIFERDHAIVMLEGKAVIIQPGTDPAGYIKYEMQVPNSVGTVYEHQKIPSLAQTKDGPKLKWAPVYIDWKQWHGRRAFGSVEFKPKPDITACLRLPDCVPGRPERSCLNLYMGTMFEPVPGECGPILRHIREVWCNGDEEAYRYVICWLARLVQVPGEQAWATIVLKSGQGTGKNIVGDIFQEYFGTHAVTITDAKALGGFNDHLALSVFTFLNEATWGGDKTLEGTLKALITDDTLLVERKFLPKYRIKNCQHILFATNNDFAVPVGMDDRRFVLLQCSEKYKNDPAYFAPLRRLIDAEGGKEAFLHYLLHDVDLQDFNPRVLPRISDAASLALRLDHKTRSAEPITRWWLEVLHAGGFRTHDQFWEWEPTRAVNRETFHQAYIESLGGTHCEPANVVARKVHSLVGEKFRTTRQTACLGARPRAYLLPPLADARAAMERLMNQAVGWQADDGEVDVGDIV